MLQFKAGVSAAQVQLRREREDLIVTLSGSNDEVRVQQFWGLNGSTLNFLNPVRFIRLTNGSTWDLNGIESAVRAGSLAGVLLLPNRT